MRLGARKTAVGLGLLGVVTLLGGAAGGDAKEVIRNSRFFKVNITKKQVVEMTPQVQAALKLDLVGVVMDQPQYWPNEKVRVKLLFPGRPGAKIKGSFQKRDATAKDFTATLDAHGLAVVELMDGTQARIQLGEYRVQARTEDGKAQGDSTFTVVDGSLGAVSFAHEFQQVTNPADLEKLDGAWFLGNASGAGKRWGNGLSFKNELRVNNKGHNGEVLVNSRCMLPGCNGTHAGPSQKIDVRGGMIAGTLNVGGHSGPFQIEVVTPKGSLRHQFEGSSHVERDFVAVSGGMTWNHRAGLAPYENTSQVPGRQIFLETARGSADPFELPSVIGQGGKVSFKVTRIVKNAVIKTFNAKADGTFEVKDIAVKGDLTTGQSVDVPVGQPYTFLAVGGFADDKFVEGWAVLFAPTELKVDLTVPAAGAPKGPLPVTISVTGAGQGQKVSGILEVFDNRVASRSPFNALQSAVGDSMRNTAQAVSYWQDRTGIDEEMERIRREEQEKAAEEDVREYKKSARKDMAPAKPRMMAAPAPAMAAGPGMGGGAMAPAAPPPPPRAGGNTGRPEKQEDPTEVIREGDLKVVACQVVETDASGKATVNVTLPPQLGRVTVRFVAVKGLDHAAAQKDADVTRAAAVEARLPRVVVPGASITVPVSVDNNTQETVTLTATGAGLQKPFTAQVKPGHQELEMAWTAGNPGILSLTLKNGAGKLLDQRELPVRSIGAEPVTYSRLVFVGKDSPVTVGSDEVAMVYAGPGQLMRGVVMNMVTTMESWFGHAEALSAQAAVRAVLLAAIHRGLIDSEGLDQTLKVGLDKSIRDLREAFFDPQEKLMRPYPGLPGNVLWTAWVSRNLHSVINTLTAENINDELVRAALQGATDLANQLDGAVRQRGQTTEELGGYDAQGRSVIPVEVDGKVVYRVVTDDAVTRWAADKLMPRVDWKQKDTELAFSKAYDTYRFLKAFERVGAIQYLTELAKGFYAQGDLKNFGELYPRIARGMILAQEPGMVQGPAMLGGVYSTPMAMVRFLELLLLMSPRAKQDAAGAVTVNGKPAAFEEAIKGTATIKAPAGAVVRLDSRGVVNMLNVGRGESVAKATVQGAGTSVGGELQLAVELDASRDPLEYYAIIAVPSTVSIKQTEDILSDYKGVLIYGQQGQGSQQMQLMAVPFRGSRTMKLLLEGAYKGQSPGVVAVRHVEDASEVFSAPIAPVTIR